jgi:eukaryotic-like serine/threonine-protein kinase
MGAEAGVVLGTVGCMLPEQVRGELVDGRTDLFACGAVLYELLSGRRPLNATHRNDDSRP